MSIVFYLASESGCRIEFAVATDEELAFRNGIYIVTCTSVLCRTGNIGCCPVVSFCFSESLLHIVVLEGHIVSLIVLSRVGDIVIVAEGLGICSDFRLECYDCLSSFCLFGGNHNDTVSSTGTVESVGSGILEDGHRFDVGRVDVVDVTCVWNTIHYVKRCRTC